MGCEFINHGGGATAIICSRGQRVAVCSVCKARKSSKLCDYPLRGRKAGKTCDAKLCERCAQQQAQQAPFPGSRVGDTIDLCPAHAKLVDAEGWPKR
jgi:hypothetical protein